MASKLFRLASLIFLFAGLTAFQTYPLLTIMKNHLPDRQDSFLTSFILWWNFSVWERGDFSEYWNAPFFYPSKDVLAYSDHLAGIAILGYPIYFLSQNIILTQNLLIFLSYTLTGVSTFLLVRHLTGNHAAAFTAGFVFAFSPFRYSRGFHLQVLTMQWIPLIFLSLHRFAERPGYGSAMAVTIFYLFNALSSGYYALFAGVFIAAFLCSLVVAHPWPLRRVLPPLFLSGLLVAVVLFPFARAYMRVADTGGFSRSLQENKTYSADVTSYLNTGYIHPFLGLLTTRFPHAEGNLYPGLVVCLLATFGVAASRRKGRDETRKQIFVPTKWKAMEKWFQSFLTVALILFGMVVGVILLWGGFTLNMGGWRISAHRLGNPVAAIVLIAATKGLLYLRPQWLGSLKFHWSVGWYLFMTIMSFLLSLGPVIHIAGHPVMSGPYVLLYQWLPGFHGLRVPARFSVFVFFGLAILAGYGVKALQKRFQTYSFRWMGLLAAVVVLIFTDFYTPSYRLVPIFPTKDLPPVYRWLQEKKDGEAVLELPLTQANNCRALYFAIYHQHPLVNGYSGFTPPWYHEVEKRLATFPSEESRKALQTLGVRYIVIRHLPWLKGGGQLPLPETTWLRIAADFGLTQVLRLEKEENSRDLPQAFAGLRRTV